ncbi:histone [Candidatus Woesearchaeota archaeon CG10_big_fil_rev_8_21_14_0_10_32_9]|nr:MAG: histone [Candidatus Woesearchaeota archaeon CG10_big_fil_rev_8_21_14_0_10_32_9]
MANKKGIPLAAMERLLKDAGAYRVAEQAKVALKEALETYALKIGESAVKYSNHAGRKTIKSEDIKLATKVQGD